MSDGHVLPIQDTSGTITFSVLVEGRELPETMELQTIVTHKEANRVPTAKLVFLDGESSSEDFELSNTDTLTPGKSIEIQMGYDVKNKTVFKGIIVKHSIKIRENKGPVLLIDCKDESVKMTVGRQNKYFTKVKDSDVMEQLISKHGLQKSVEATAHTHDELVQYYTSDWDLLLARAEVNGQLVLVDDGKVNVKAPKLASSAKLTLLYGGTLYEFEAEIDARFQYKSAKSSAWDYKNQALTEKSGKAPAPNGMGNLSEQDLAKVIGLADLQLKHGGKVAEAELQSWADATLLKGSLAKIVGRAKIEGYAEIKPGDTVEFKGVGNRFNGKAYICGVRQDMIEGTWFTHLQIGLPPHWHYQEQDTMEKPAAGLLPGVNGVQIGIVTKLGGDPNGEDRIQVRLPVVDPNSSGIWARLASLDAGQDRGFVFRPEIGDEVIVAFINDDPRDAVVLGMLHSSAKAAPIPPDDNNHEKGLKTRSKMRVWFDDDKKVMTLETPGGNSIEINDDKKQILLKDQTGNTVTLNDKGIELKSPKDIKIEATGKIELKATQDCTIEGMNVGLKANAEFKAEGQAGAKLSTSAIAEIKGSLVKIN